MGRGIVGGLVLLGLVVMIWFGRNAVSSPCSPSDK